MLSMIRKVCLPVLLVVSMLFIIACGGDAPANAPTPAASKPTAASESSDAPETSAAPEKLDIKSLDKGVDALKSYRMRFNVVIDGKDKDGKAQKGSIEILDEAIKESKDHHMRMSLSGDMAAES